MDIVITEWALQSYLELRGREFTNEEYWKNIRPDVELLKDFPSNSKFELSNFWGPCKDKSQARVPNCYKMKWHNIGPGRVQLRLLVVFSDDMAYLCQAYVKRDEKVDKRQIAKIKIRAKLIERGQVEIRGRLK
ncbi:MAG: hypothetical protein CMO81_01185 [Waddliaceae bacterium]|nr:hypothetical protein [Waddliaceae bacterium]